MDAEAVQQPQSERPPYSYMAMIQFAINSRKNRRMTLKEIYTWIEDHFPYFREVAKPGWKVQKWIITHNKFKYSNVTIEIYILIFFSHFSLQNSIRHNLSLHDMFLREASPDGKVSFWTIRPEANRCLTLDQVYKVSSLTSNCHHSFHILPTFIMQKGH